MARGVNKVILIGNLGADPESRSTTSGGQIVTFSLATTDSWNDKQSGEKRERTEWHRIKAFGRLGEICAQYLSKGQQVYIEGRIQTDKFTGKDGVEKYFTDIIANDMQMLGGRGEGGGSRGSSGGGYDRPQQRPANAPAAAMPADDMPEDDIPF
ncbi:MAG TPA: single-stranded DNA-binding protein [Rhodanobacteraceae bacterium]|nr:single-stranded DNA-binding protein [Rhodanobacteraceae bacterium]